MMATRGARPPFWPLLVVPRLRGPLCSVERCYCAPRTPRRNTWSMIVYASAGSQELWADRACYRCERWLRDMDRLRPSLASSRVQALRAVEARPRLIHRVNNLPVQLSSFVGRTRESAQIGELLSSMRLLTLTGPGGIGKTRLALAVASAALDAYPDGVWLAELAGVADPLLGIGRRHG